MIHLLQFFNTINSGLVHLIQGRCAQILFEIWDYRWFVFTSFAFLFRKKLEKTYLKKKPLVQDRIPPPSIYIHMCTFYAYTNTCMPRFSPSGFFGPSRCLTDFWAHNRVPHLCSVCVCVHTHTCTHIHFHRVKNRQDTDNTPMFPRLLSKISLHAKQQVLS